MNTWKRLRLQNSMLLAMVGANLLAGLSMDILIIQGDAPPSPSILRLAGFLDFTLFFFLFAPGALELQWVRAGHDPALLYGPAADHFEMLKGDGFVKSFSGQ